MKVEVVLYICDGVDWLAEYVYFIDGYVWSDQKNFKTIIPKKERMDYTRGWRKPYPPVELRVY